MVPDTGNIEYWKYRTTLCSIRLLLGKGQYRKLYLFVYLTFIEHLLDAQNFHKQWMHRNANRENSLWIKTYISSSQSVVPRQAASASPGNLLEMQILGSQPSPTKIRISRCGVQIYFNYPSRCVWCMPEFKNHCSMYYWKLLN